MVNENSGQKEVIAGLQQLFDEMKVLYGSLNEEQVNLVPYPDSWSASQLVDHVLKSTNGISAALKKDAEAAQRDPGERIAELKGIFLDYTTKFQAPDFIVPGKGSFVKAQMESQLTIVRDQLKMDDSIDMRGLVSGLPFGPVTKLELLHFILYHTMRHVNQLQKIIEALKNK